MFLLLSPYAHRQDLPSFPTRRSSDLGAAASVHMTLELDAVVVHAAEAVEREHLEPARIGEQRPVPGHEAVQPAELDRKSTRLNSSHRCISYAVFCLKKKKNNKRILYE